MGIDQLESLGGLNVLVGGDPDYESIVLGNPNPENSLIDPAADGPVSQFVLDTFDIPFDLGNVLGGDLPGLDIKNQDATTMLRLSLAAELLDPPDGQAGFAEVELDAFGIARFYVAGATAATNLDVRYCVPTSQVIVPADLVIVRGFDPPPERVLRDTFDGLKNKEIMDYKDCAEQSCDESIVSQYASVVYDDPQLDQTYLDDIVNSYELQAFESLLGYLIDLDLPDGADPNSPNFVPGLKLTFGETSREYIKLDATLFNASILGGTLTDDEGVVTNIVTRTNNSNTIAIAGTSSSIPVTVTTVSARGDKCSVDVTALAGSTVVIPASRFTRINKFGRPESDFIGIESIVFSGRKVESITISPGTTLGGFSQAGLVKTVVRPSKELVSMEQGKNWTYEVDPVSLDVTLNLFSVIEEARTSIICSAYQDPTSVTGNPNTTAQTFSSSDLIGEETNSDGSAFTNFSDHICNIGDGLGYRTTNGKICVVITRTRPSIDIFDPSGNALVLAGQVAITYTPIVIVDTPAPIAYASTTPLTSDDGTRTLAAEGIIDQADGIVDSNPSTVQDLEDSELSTLQDNTAGATIDITLPFCTDDECLQIARNFLALQTEEVSTHSMILGPDSEPRLGDFIAIPGGDIGVINDINYSYSDSSQYLITVSVGPLYLSAGSFNNSQYQLQTEDVTREGYVVRDGGNGAEYIVRIEGIGEITALLMVLEDVSVGDKVGIRIYNNPVEKI